MPRNLAPFEGGWNTDSQDYRLMHSASGGATFLCRPAIRQPVLEIAPSLRDVPPEAALLVRRLFIADPAKLSREEMAPLLADTPEAAGLRRRVAAWPRPHSKRRETVAARLIAAGLMDRDDAGDLGIAPYGGRPSTDSGPYRIMHGPGERSTWRKVTFLCRPAERRPVAWVSPSMRELPERIQLLVWRLFLAPPGDVTREEMAPLLADTSQASRLRGTYQAHDLGRGVPSGYVARRLQELGHLSYRQSMEDISPGWYARFKRYVAGLKSRSKDARS